MGSEEAVPQTPDSAKSLTSNDSHFPELVDKSVREVDGAKGHSELSDKKDNSGSSKSLDKSFGSSKSLDKDQQVEDGKKQTIPEKLKNPKKTSRKMSFLRKVFK